MARRRGKRGGRRNAVKAIRRALQAHVTETGDRGSGLAVAWTETPTPHSSPGEHLRTVHSREDVMSERAAFLAHNDVCNLIEEYHGPWKPTRSQRARRRVVVPGSNPKHPKVVPASALESHERYLNTRAAESDMQAETRKRRGPACRNTAAREEIRSGRIHVKR